MSSFIPNYFKTKVSKNRKRHKEFGLDLDLTYITERIIAMAFPAERMESIYRNRLNDVCEFFERKHKDHYYIYNLCSERSYDKAKFQNRVRVYPFDDHNPPSFPVIGSFCRDVDKCLHANPDNVVAIHCKAGKGRTGTMICCYLLHSGRFATAEEAIEFYGNARTEDGRGVTIPSQIRYVKYYEQFLREGEVYYPTSVYIKRVHLRPPPKFTEQAVLTVREKVFEATLSARDQILQDMIAEERIVKGEEVDYESKYSFMEEGKKIEIPQIKDRTKPDIEVEYPTCTNSGDIRLELFYRSPYLTKKKRLARVWINSYFAEKNGLPCANGDRFRDLIFRKDELDVAWKKDRKHRYLSEDFELKIHLEIPPSSLERRDRIQQTAGSAAVPQGGVGGPRGRRNDDSSGAEEDTEDENDSESGKFQTRRRGDGSSGAGTASGTVNDGASTSTGARFPYSSPAIRALRRDAQRTYSSTASESSTTQSLSFDTTTHYRTARDAISSASSNTPASLLNTPVGGCSDASTAVVISQDFDAVTISQDLDAITISQDLDTATTASCSVEEETAAAHNYPCVGTGVRPFRTLAPAPPVKILGIFPVKRRRFVVVDTIFPYF